MKCPGWTQEQTAVGGAVTGVFTIADLSVPYVAGGVAGDTVFVQISAALGMRVRTGHQILLRDASDYRVDVIGKVTDVTRGATTVLAVRLLENDDNSPAHDLSDCDNFKIVGNINPEGGEMPEAIALNPTKVYNFTQIFRTPLSTTRTAMKTNLRTGNDYQKAKAEALEMHSWEMELAFLWGIRTENIGDNGKPERTTMGVINFIRQYATANCDDFTLNATYAGQGWTDALGSSTAGQVWLDNFLEQVFRYGAEEKLCLCGSGFLLGIQALAQAGGTINLAPTQKIYGMQIREWLTPFGSIYMKTHPLFSFDATTRNMGLLLEPKELEYKYIDDTSFYGESSSKQHSSGYGQRRIDGLNEEYLTESGLEFGLPQKCAVLNGVGLDNDL
uniref:Putative capsid protein n=1 Tax=viral metagenome TaxID=1070528 RepID=A0A6M3JTT1_9ZZZZ